MYRLVCNLGMLSCFSRQILMHFLNLGDVFIGTGLEPGVLSHCKGAYDTSAPIYLPNHLQCDYFKNKIN